MILSVTFRRDWGGSQRFSTTAGRGQKARGFIARGRMEFAADALLPGPGLNGSRFEMWFDIKCNFVENLSG